MISIKNYLKQSICFGLTLFVINANAQVSYEQNALTKLEGYKNFSYKSIYREKEYNINTTIIQQKDIFQKAAEDKTFGYLFTMETLTDENKYPRTEVYNGKNILSIYSGDSTYYFEKIQPSIISQTLIGQLNWIKNFLEKKPSYIKKATDTTIYGIDSYHLVINTRDTLINNEHYYSRIHLFIDKLSGMPDCITGWAKYENPTGGARNYYSETRYFDYAFNQDNVDIVSVTIPKGYHLPKEPAALLVPGSVAPEWTLYTTNGRKVSLSQLKGKVVLMDFYFIGCQNCMEALKPLNDLYDKFLKKDFVIVSITERDGKKSVSEFDKNYHIKYASFFNAADVIKSYHISGFPTFYFIDKKGKIADVQLGYGEEFEGKAISIINSLLNK